MNTVCMRKTRYSLMGQAEKVARQRRAETGSLIQAYPCSDCGGYHIGNVPLRRLRKK